MNVVAIIPARMGSSRFPGKPMAKIHGVPMIGHVYERTARCTALSGTYVATCDREIADYIEAIGGKAVMTSDTHERATDRCAEALLKVEQSTGKRVDVVVMVQGDEPMVTPTMIQESISPFATEPGVQVVNLTARIESLEDFSDPNEIKVVMDLAGNAIYFSREPIPTTKRSSGKVPMWKQVCIIPFRRDYLIRFNSLPPTPLEIAESVDMMRILEHGEKVRMVKTAEDTVSVDTLEDLELVSRLMQADSLRRTYPPGQSISPEQEATP